MESPSSSPRNERLNRLLGAALSGDWRVRAEAARGLAAELSEPVALDQLVSLLNDPDTAVIEEAVQSLVLAGGEPGLKPVLKALGESQDNVGYHIIDRLTSLWLSGAPILDLSRQILAANPEKAVYDGASEIVEMLGDRGSG